MDDKPNRFTRVELVSLGIILVLFATLSVVGITWGLPSRKIDTYLFGDGPPWPGEKIYRLVGAGEKFAPTRGADVDIDPVDKTGDEPIHLTATEADVAKIYLRYRLYTYQPDEMITMMALAGMSPGSLRLDPKLYQYGGFFIYPVGALIGACGAVGLIDVRGDVVYYLDNPDEFGKFYIVARGYSAAWGLIGVVVVFAIARRLAGRRAGVLAALLFTLMPVVVCMAHEGKPHLPGAVLMLGAVLFAMRHLSESAIDPRHPPLGKRGLRGGTPLQNETGSVNRRRINWWLMCICCGAAFSMVLSSGPIFILIPLVALLQWRRTGGTVKGSSPASSPDASRSLFVAGKQTIIGVVIGMLVYLVTNPYIVINALTNREVLRSNFGNSFAMYEIARVAEGFVRVVELTAEGATWPILLCGVIALILASARRNTAMLPLVVPALVFFLQFVMIGAGKPAEYGRFGIFTNTALAIGSAYLLGRRWGRLPAIVTWVSAMLAVVWVAQHGAAYLLTFTTDSTAMRYKTGSRIELAIGIDAWFRQHPTLRERFVAVSVPRAPGPYNCPPLNFSSIPVYLTKSEAAVIAGSEGHSTVFIRPVDRPSRTPPVVPPSGAAGRRAYTLHTPRLVWINRWLPPFAPISWANKPLEFHVSTWPIRSGG